MDYKKLLGDIINAIPQSITPTNKKGTNAEICDKIQQTAISIGHPFHVSKPETHYLYSYTGSFVRIG